MSATNPPTVPSAPPKLTISLEWGRPKVIVTVDGISEKPLTELIGPSQLPALLNSCWTEWALRCAEAIDPQAAAEFRKYAMAAGGAPEPESSGLAASIGGVPLTGQFDPLPMMRKKAARTFALNEQHETHVPKRRAARRPKTVKAKKKKAAGRIKRRR